MKLTRSRAFLLLVLYAVLIGIWTWRFMPKSAHAAEIWDSQPTAQEGIAAWLAAAPQDTALPALLALARMPEEQVQILAAWLSFSPDRQIRQLTVQKAPIADLGPEWNAALLHTWLAQTPQIDLIEVHLMIAAAGDRVADNQRQAILEDLARRAQRQGDLVDAVTILGRACELPGATWETLRQLTMAARTARHPGPAQKALRLWIQRHADTEQDSLIEEAKDQAFSLMMEAGDVEEALSQQLAEFAGTAPYSEHALDRAWLAAQQARQGSRFLPYLERHLQSFSEHSLSIQALQQQSDISPNYLRWLSCYASICDDEQPNAVSFAAFLRLVAARDPRALPRLCALAKTPAQIEQLDEALNAALDCAETQSTVLQLAQTHPVAKRMLALRLRQAPYHRQLHYAATLAAAAAQSQGSASVLWQEFLRRFPDDVSARRRLIQAHLQDHQPAMALRAYAELPNQSLTEDDRHQMTILQQL